MSEATELEAGAILLPGSHDGADADGLTARTYAHPVLDDRKIVRLVPETLGEAEDLALDFLGLRREGEAPVVGQVRRETLGFPAWALVNDPANGHHALALVRDIERLARLAGPRAGHARDGFEELGERLARSMPHFLPTYYEQAARAFLAAENSRYAAAFFGRARTAERAHGLPVDEARQRAVFLEFAFAGALTAKELKEHVRDLTRRLPAAAAWAEFRQLTVERCAAGLPPYASFPQDSRRLIRAAGLDVAAEERAVLAELLGSPAIVRAPRTFWTGHREALAALGRERPAIRRRLIEIIPSSLAAEDEGDELWLRLLAETGADALLTAQGPDPEVDAADWLSRWATHLTRGWRGPRHSPASYALAHRMAPRLRADGRPVRIAQASGWRGGTDLELLDLCLAEGIPVADPPPRLRFDLTSWLAAPEADRRDLAAVAGDPRFAPALSTVVGETGGQRDGEALAAVVAHPVLRRVLRDWLGARTDEFVAAPGLPAGRTALDALLPFGTTAAEVSPEAMARVAGHRLGPVVARTLRAGIFDELGWPALEEAVRLLGETSAAGQQRQFSIHQAWPALIIGDAHRAVVVGSEGVLLEHELRIPDQLHWQRPEFRYVDGELLVTWWHRGEQRAYWSARPDEIFVLGGARPGAGHRPNTAVSLALPGGGRATGGRPLHAGDTALPEERPVLADDSGRHWSLTLRDGRWAWHEYDPATGAEGRASLPAFLAGAVSDDARLLPEHCALLPLPPALADTPLGTDGRQLGWWVRAEGEDGLVLRAGSTDGRTFTLAGRGPRRIPVGAPRLPGGAEPVLAIHGAEATLFANGAHPVRGALGSATVGQPGGVFAAGTPLMPPVPFWHLLRPRDEAGSHALRALTDEAAERLVAAVAEVEAEQRAARAAALEAGREIPEAERRRAEERALTAAVARELPEITDHALRRGVAGIARVAARIAAASRLADQSEANARPADTAMFEGHRPRHGDDATLLRAVEGLTTPGIRMPYGGSTSWAVLQQVRAVGQVLAGRPATGRPLPARYRAEPLPHGWSTDERTAPAHALDWTPLLAAQRAVAHRATGQVLGEAEREALLLLLEALAEGPLAGQGALRRLVLAERGVTARRGGQVLRHGDRVVVILGTLCEDREADRTHWLALDHDPAGAFGPVPPLTFLEERVFAGRPAAPILTDVVRLVRERGPAPWRPEPAAALAAATGLGHAQATLLLAGLPTQPTAETLALLGLRARQAEHAAELLAALGTQGTTTVIGALPPKDPAGAWSEGPDTAAAAGAWRSRFSGHHLVPEDTIAELGLDPRAAMAVLNPEHTPWLRATTSQRLQDHRLRAADPEAVPDERELASAVTALATLAYGLPLGHPLRAALPGALDGLRRRLADPGLVLDLGIEWAEAGGSTARRLRQAHGLPEAGGAGADGLVRIGEALVVFPWYGSTEATWLRPAGLTGPDDPTLGLVEGIVAARARRPLDALRAVLGGDLDRAVRAGAPGAEGYAQDPLRSVPELVAEAAARLGLSEDAAAGYLQLLALPDPTDRNRARWTGWQPARIRRANAELAATDLVVSAQRSRAGRRLFLPGGWTDHKAPLLPVETWKEPLYRPRPVAHGVPHLPVPELFERAWARVRDGDAPAYEQLITRATRKGRR
ncbi:hypothetical protein E1265_16930 [Streptomyces sp. 8K308]|uniref:hypothetical protein n=1 Tax=Streptomyces sp. 8K308 TaxID=2530388 RepID=UPI001043AA0C|nr:hypothetical protein [Streptomyces sp. 8K308]TDC21875.1 hypothetical protein E1265_16930 [Streptomyces sp. 8K308]